MIDPKALEALTDHQRQLDQDGVFVGVSREALEMLLADYRALTAALAAAEAQPVAWMSEDKWCVITDRQLKNVPELSDPTPLYPIPLYASPPVASTADGWPEPETEMVWAQNLRGFIRGVFPADEQWKEIFIQQLNALAARPPSVDTEARRMALEEAAKIAETTGIDNMNEWPGETWIAQRIATAIRALIPQEGKADA